MQLGCTRVLALDAVETIDPLGNNDCSDQLLDGYSSSFRDLFQLAINYVVKCLHELGQD